MYRRSFLAAILASAIAPAIVRADSLMRIVPRDTLLAHSTFLARSTFLAGIESAPFIPSEFAEYIGSIITFHITKGISNSIQIGDILSYSKRRLPMRVISQSHHLNGITHITAQEVFNELVLLQGR